MRIELPYPPTLKAPNGQPLAFLKRVAYIDYVESCVVWPYVKEPNGYGTLRYANTRKRAHRLVCRMAHGEPVGDRIYAAHNCGNSSCVNPYHLRWATPSENQWDRVTHGTSNRGSKQGSSKLKEEDIRFIRNNIHTIGSRKMAAKFGISQKYVNTITARKVWSWLDE